MMSNPCARLSSLSPPSRVALSTPLLSRPDSFFYANALSDPGRSCLQDPHACVPPYESHVTPPGPARVYVHMSTEGDRRGKECTLPFAHRAETRVWGSGGCKYIGKEYRRAFVLNFQQDAMSTRRVLHTYLYFDKINLNVDFENKWKSIYLEISFNPYLEIR